MSLVDLHSHTSCSDGRLSPPGLVEKAHLRGLAGLAVTDHDTVAGLPLAAAAARERGMHFVNGVELSADIDGSDVHILAYGFDPGNRALREHLATFREARLDRARLMTERLASLGVPVRYERVLFHARGGAVGRPHVARALVEAGHVDTFGQAFSRYLADGAPAYVAKYTVSPEVLLRLIRDAGGVCALAHPGDSIEEALVSQLVEIGLWGIEVIHPSHDKLLQERWRTVAERHGLVATGGSDYHGYGPAEEESFGRYGVPPNSIERLIDGAV